MAAIAAGAYYYWFHFEPELVPVTEEPAVAPEDDTWQPFWEAELEAPEPRYRVPETRPAPEPAVEDEPRPAEDIAADTDEAAETVDAVEVAEPVEPVDPLPPLDDSDDFVQQELEQMAQARRLWELFIPEFIIRHFVVTIDNMTASKLPQQYNFAQPPPGTFTVREIADETYSVDPKNYDRYRRYIEFTEAIDLDRAVALYVRLYPLFQQAYEELGYPQRYFNDRMVEVIDHLLATPDVDGDVELVRPKVYYEFADSELEELSAGQKLLLRTGPDNAGRIKSRLLELRVALTTLDAEARGTQGGYEYIPPPP